MVNDLVNALAEFRIFVGKKLSAYSYVSRTPCLPCVFGPVNSAGGDRDGHSVRIAKIGQNGVEAQAAAARLPLRALLEVEKPFDRSPALAAVMRLEQRSGLDSRIAHVPVVPAPRFYLPDLTQRKPGFSWKAHILALRIAPGFAEIVARADRCAPVHALWCGIGAGHPVAVVEGKGVHRLSLEVRSVELPFLARAVGPREERSLHRANHHAHAAARGVVGYIRHDFSRSWAGIGENAGALARAEGPSRVVLISVESRNGAFRFRGLDRCRFTRRATRRAKPYQRRRLGTRAIDPHRARWHPLGVGLARDCRSS